MKSILINLVRRISLRLESNTSWRISPFFNILSLELNQMICAYNDYYTSIAQHKLGSMLELAVHDHGISAGEFAEKFVESPVCRAFEYGDPVFQLEKSTNELLGIVLDLPVCEKEQDVQITPEYWAGWVLAYIQWYTALSFKTILEAYPIDELLLDYSPYHEMDISEILGVVRKPLGLACPLKRLRVLRKLSQIELSKISDVSLRAIRAYEQGTLELSKAQGETIYKLAKALNCSMEYLIR